MPNSSVSSLLLLLASATCLHLRLVVVSASEVADRLHKYDQKIVQPLLVICQNSKAMPCDTAKKLHGIIHGFHLHLKPNDVYDAIFREVGSISLKFSGKLSQDEAKQAQKDIPTLFEHNSMLKGEEKEDQIRSNLKAFYTASIVGLKSALNGHEKHDPKSLWIKAYTMLRAADWMRHYFHRNECESLDLMLLQFAANLLAYGIEIESPGMAQLASEWPLQMPATSRC